MSITVEQLVAHYRDIAATRMRGLPIMNPRLEVEAVGFRDCNGEQVGILITPWFMNLVVLPRAAAVDRATQGTEVERQFPAGAHMFALCRDADPGDYLSAVLFRTVADFPDQDTAREIATTTLEMLFAAPQKPDTTASRISRRELFSRFGAA